MWITQPQVADAAARRMERKGKGKGRKAGAARTAPEAEPEPFTILRVASGANNPAGREDMQSFLGLLPREQWIDCVPLRGKPEYYEYFRECCGQCGVTAMAAAKHPRLPTILFQVADVLRSQAGSGRRVYLGLRCNHGKHRSVAVGELVGRCLQTVGLQVEGYHTASEKWGCCCNAHDQDHCPMVLQQASSMGKASLKGWTPMEWATWLHAYQKGELIDAEDMVMPVLLEIFSDLTVRMELREGQLWVQA